MMSLSLSANSPKFRVIRGLQESGDGSTAGLCSQDLSTVEGPLSSELLPLSWKRWESSSSEWRKGQSSVVRWSEVSPCGSTNLGRQCRPKRIENALCAP